MTKEGENMKIAVMTLLLVLATPTFAAKEKFRDDQMLRDVQSTFWEAWNRHDAKQMAALFADEGTIVNPYGRTASGRSGVEKLFAEEHAAAMKESQGISNGLQIQFVNRNTALVDEEVEMGGIKNPDGKLMEPQRYHLANVIIKKSGKWWIMGSRGYFLATSPENSHH